MKISIKMWNEDDKDGNRLFVGDKGGRNSTKGMHGLGFGCLKKITGRLTVCQLFS